MTENQPQILFTDLDGTLLNSKSAASKANLKALERLGQNRVVRVIATGRSLYSFNRTISADFPVDYLIFSSGAGILDFRNETLLYSACLKSADISCISAKLDEHRADHMIHHEVPDNHRFTYRRHSSENPDFSRRVSLYSEFAENCKDGGALPDRSAQIIAILPFDTRRFNIIKDSLNGYQVTRTTSPLDHTSLWMEVYPANIHKGSAAAWLCSRLDISTADSVGIGNDFNDIELLDFTARSFIVGNGPQELHSRYAVTKSNDDDGFSEAIGRVLTE